MPFLKQSKEGIEVHVRATPNAKIEKTYGIETRDDGKSYLKIKIRAIAEDGAANDAVIKLLSKLLKIPKSEIILTSGNKNRIKTLLVISKNIDIDAARFTLSQ